MDELESKRKQRSEPESEILELRSRQNLNHLECEHLKQLEAFEAVLTAAVDIKVPKQLAEKIILNTDMSQPAKKSFTLQRFFAMAASVGVMSFLALRLILFTPSSAVAEDALQHLYHDIEHLSEKQIDANVRMQRAMKVVGLFPDLKLQHLSFAANCHIGKRLGVHLVVNINSQTYTLLLLPSLEVDKTEYFSDDNFHGQIVAIDEGALIVIGMKNVELQPVVEALQEKLKSFKVS